MIAEPRIVDRAAQPYVAAKGHVTMQNVGAIADRLPEVFGWLGERGIEHVGAPFFKFNLIDMTGPGHLEIEVGVPVAEPVAGEGEILAGVLPAGRYATVTHVGHPGELMGVTGELLDWAFRHGLTWDFVTTDEGERWASRLEVYRTDPAEQPDMTKWETDLVFRLAG